MKGAETKSRDLIGVAVILLLFACSMAEGAKWVSLLSDPEGNEWYIDIESIVRPSTDTAKVWIKMAYSDKRKADIAARLGPKYSDLKESEILYEHNCATGEVRSLAGIDYDSQRHQIASHTFENAWNPIAPGSNGEIVYKLVCPKKEEK
ncbi:MAG: surface-adhesin E family protein [Chloroflexota bacterium]